MELTILGASPAFPNPGGASSGYLLRTDEVVLLMDCGHGAAGRLLAVCAPSDLSAVVISHMHPDHVFDLVPLHYALEKMYSRPPLPLLLPPGGIADLRRLGSAIGDVEFFTGAFDMREYDPVSGFDLGDVSVQFAPTTHFSPGFGIRATSITSHRSLVFTADTARSTTIENLAQGCQLLLAEATLLDHADPESESGHMTGTQVGSLALRSGVDRLLLTHYVASQGAQVLQQAATAFGGPTELAREGASYDV